MIMRRRPRRRDVRGIAPIELLLVFPILLILGGMILCFQMVLIRSTDLTLAGRTASWDRLGEPLSRDEPLVIPDIRAMSPMLPDQEELNQGVIHEERRGAFRLSLGYIPRTTQLEEHHFVLDDCWTHERLTQYQGHGRLRPESSMLRFVSRLMGSGTTALKFLPAGLASSFADVDRGAFGLFGSFADMAGISTGRMTSGMQNARQARAGIGPRMAEALLKTPIEMAKALRDLNFSKWAKLGRGLSQMGKARSTMNTLDGMMSGGE